jgi:hypothetical protein
MLKKKKKIPYELNCRMQALPQCYIKHAREKQSFCSPISNLFLKQNWNKQPYRQSFQSLSIFHGTALLTHPLRNGVIRNRIVVFILVHPFLRVGENGILVIELG